mgnify:CR=1 FL=1
MHGTCLSQQYNKMYVFFVVVCFATWSLKNRQSVSSVFGIFFCAQQHVLKIIQFNCFNCSICFVFWSIIVCYSLYWYYSQLYILLGWWNTLIMVSRAVLTIMVFLVYITIKWYVCIRLILFCHTMFPQVVFEVRIIITVVTLDILCLFTRVFFNLSLYYSKLTSWKSLN